MASSWLVSQMKAAENLLNAVDTAVMKTVVPKDGGRPGAESSVQVAPSTVAPQAAAESPPALLCVRRGPHRAEQLAR